MKKYLFITVLAALAGNAYAADANNVGCGWGTMVFNGKSDKASQVLAATTNNIFGNQTFGISSGTIGCAENSTIKQYSAVNTFMTANVDKVAHDMSVGKGESLDTLASLMDMNNEDKAAFAKLMKANFATIFPDTNTTSTQALKTMASLMAKDPQLARYTTA